MIELIPNNDERTLKVLEDKFLLLLFKFNLRYNNTSYIED